MAQSIRFPVTHYTANLAPTGFPFLGEGLFLGYRLCEEHTGREFRFCKFNLSGVAVSAGVPVIMASTFGVVTPDLSDAGTNTSANKSYPYKFAGIALATHAPTSGSTTYGWVMTKGPLGKIPASYASTADVKVLLHTASARLSTGRCFMLSTLDKKLVAFSTSAYNSVKGAVNFIYYGAQQVSTVMSANDGMLINLLW